MIRYGLWLKRRNIWCGAYGGDGSFVPYTERYFNTYEQEWGKRFTTTDINVAHRYREECEAQFQDNAREVREIDD